MMVYCPTSYELTVVCIAFHACYTIHACQDPLRPEKLQQVPNAYNNQGSKPQQVLKDCIMKKKRKQHPPPKTLMQVAWNWWNEDRDKSWNKKLMFFFFYTIDNTIKRVETKH